MTSEFLGEYFSFSQTRALELKYAITAHHESDLTGRSPMSVEADDNDLHLVLACAVLSHGLLVFILLVWWNLALIY